MSVAKELSEKPRSGSWSVHHSAKRYVGMELYMFLAVHMMLFVR